MSPRVRHLELRLLYRSARHRRCLNARNLFICARVREDRDVSQPREKDVRRLFKSRSFRAAILVVVSNFFSLTTFGQETQTPLPDAPTAQKAATVPSAAVDVDVTWKELPKRFLQDQKMIWLFPIQIAKGRYLIPTLAVV